MFAQPGGHPTAVAHVPLARGRRERLRAPALPRQAVVECFTAGIALTREIPLLARLVETEPEIITGVGGSTGTSTILGSAHRVAQALRRSGATMPEHELHVVAELMLRIAYTYMLNPLGTVDMTDDVAVRDYAGRYLAPLVY